MHQPSPDRSPDDQLVDGAPEASFQAQLSRRRAVRAGVIVGTALVVVVGAAVAMGASPAPAASAPTGTGSTTVPWLDDVPFGEFRGPGGPGDRGGPGKGHGLGTISVTAISGSNVSLATDDGWTRTIAVTSATTITRGGATATLADVAVGDIVRFAQTRNDDGTYTITRLAILLPREVGTVTVVGADSITITTRAGTSEVIRTTSATTYRLGRTDGTRADVTVGAVIGATGERADDGTLTATTVHVRLPHASGTVGAVTGDTLTVTRRDGTSLTVHVASGTSIAVAGVANATLADVKAGMLVAVAGTQRADGSLDAVEIHARVKGMLRGGHGDFGPGGTGDDPADPDPSSGATG